MPRRAAHSGGGLSRVALSPSSWSYMAPFYMGRVRRAGWLGVPAIIVGAFTGTEWLLFMGVIASGVAMLLAIRNQRDAYATPSVIHCRSGFLGYRVEDIPVGELDEIFVDAVPFLPGIGTLTLKCGPRYFTLEGVPRAVSKQAALIHFRDAARVRASDESQFPSPGWS